MFFAPRPDDFALADHHAFPPPRPDLTETIWSPSPPVERCRRYLRGLLYRLPDAGLPGLTPLRTHVLICGYPRAGTTLLQAMVEHALPHARRFGREVSGWRAATYAWRNHAVIVSKKPDDLLLLHRLRNFYARHPRTFRPILMVRDPRDVLTSRHPSTGPNAYFVDPHAWRTRHDYYLLYRQDPDVLIVTYEDLVSDPAAVQSRVDAFTGEPAERPFADFHRARLDRFDTSPLNGVRPVDRKTIGRWSAPQHAPRLAQLLRQIPDLPDILIGMGYEPNAHWAEPYLRP